MASLGHYVSEETKDKISKSQLGDKSNNWRGGKWIDKHGYVRLTLPIDSPFLPMAHKTKSRRRVRDITEHRLVMAQHIGRCLYPWEVVHHKNGIKTDNRIENLQLMSGLPEHMPSANWERYIEQIKSESYEQGKRDMLEALRNKSGTILANKKRNIVKVGRFSSFYDGTGRVVFIPDEGGDV